ncbi:hypothetical protein BVRB_9g209570 [Beta vulgaris subsp. vulgaris]|nr:hypothetical protein BVRB_9g209570 [Beta vulgaris subsp. vulgaris]
MLLLTILQLLMLGFVARTFKGEIYEAHTVVIDLYSYTVSST